LNPLKVENLGDISIPVSVKVLTVYVRRVTIKKVFSNNLNETGYSKAEKNIGSSLLWQTTEQDFGLFQTAGLGN
jgi:hypothetical protein